MNIYEEQKFIAIENTRLKNLWLNGHSKYQKLETAIVAIKKGFFQELEGLFDVEYAL
jgi:hypothetical protein